MKSFSKPFRLFRSGFFYLLFAALFCPPLAGQFKFREPPNRQLPDTLSESVGQELWNWFLFNRDSGVFEIEGALTYRPAGSSSVRYQFQMQGNWQTLSQETTLTLTDEDGDAARRKVIQKDGQTRIEDSEGERILKGEAWTQPVQESFPVTWMDLLMPYFDWEEVTYMGPDRYLGRPAHRFSLSNPEPDSFPATVTVTLDGDYAAVLKAELFDRSGSLLKRMRVGGIKKFDDGWMFSELNWEDREERSSIRLKVTNYKSPQS